MDDTYCSFARVLFSKASRNFGTLLMPFFVHTKFTNFKGRPSGLLAQLAERLHGKREALSLSLDRGTIFHPPQWPPNVTGEEKAWPDQNSNPMPLAYHASILLFELMSHLVVL